MNRRLPIAVIAALLATSTGAVAQTTFNVTVANKTAAHPLFGEGHNEGYLVDGAEGKEVVLMRGTTYTFQMVNVPDLHPFYISTSASGGGAGTYSDGVTNNNVTGNSALTFTPTASAPELLYYQCSFHPSMGGRIVIQGSSASIESSIVARGAAMLAYPNPATDRATVALRSGASTRIRIALHDVLGRELGVIFDDDVVAGEPINASLDASSLAPGTYTLHATGDGVSVASQIVVR